MRAHLGCEVLHRVDSDTTAGLGEALHVAALRTAQGKDSLAREQLKGSGVNTYP